MTLAEIFEKRRVVISVGTGGVGKTTISAAMAIQAALMGKKVLVITIDPAKRLATSLGLKEFGSEAIDLSEALQKVCRQSQPPIENPGQLWALIPDTAKTFDQMVHDVAKDEATAQAVLRNPIFSTLTKEFSGANEYMAVQKLDQIFEQQIYDLIILDTPPSRSALAFLDAPSLLSQFFEEKLIRWLVVPANKIATTGMRKALKILEKLTGTGFVSQLYDFMAALFTVQTGLTSRLSRIKALLASPEVGFMLVTTPSPENLTDFLHLKENIELKSLHLDGLILNRSMSAFASEVSAQKAEGSPQLLAAWAVIADQIAKEKRFLQVTQAIPSIRVQELARDVHSLQDLLIIASELNQGQQ